MGYGYYKPLDCISTTYQHYILSHDELFRAKLEELLNILIYNI